MASIRTEVSKRTGKKSYRVQYRTPEGKLTGKRFELKRDAQMFISSMEVAKSQGMFVQETAGRVKVDELGPEWLQGKQVLKPSSYAPLEAAWRNHVQPRWGARSINTIRKSEVQSWVSELSRGKNGSGGKSASVVIRAYGILAGILDAAVDDRRLGVNPARGVELPRKGKKSKTYLTHEQVQKLAEASKYPAIIYLMAYTGMRWGEVCALRVRHVNFLKRRILIEENAVHVGKSVHVGTPKSHEKRTVPLSPFLLELLAAAAEGKAPEEILFPGQAGGYMSAPRSAKGHRSWFARALDAADVPRVTPHGLRDTAASLAVQSGAHVKVLQRMLGHASAKMTLDTYADLFDGDLDDVAAAMERERLSKCSQNVVTGD